MVVMSVGAAARPLFALSPRFNATLGALGAVALVSAAAPAHAVAINYGFQDIVNTNDTTFNQELGINSAGTIAGYFGAGNGLMGHPNQGYTVVPPYAQANFTAENVPGSVQTQVTGLNNTGTTVGFWAPSNNGGDNNFGFVDIANTFTNVNNPNTPLTGPMINQLLGVNNGNVAVGFYVDPNGATHGYTYNIAGNTFSGNIDDPNGVGATTAAAINNAGEIAGFYTDAVTGVTHGFIDNSGTFTTIDPTGSTSTMLLGLNDNGLAVGTYIDAGGIMHGLLFDLNNDTFQNIDDPNVLPGTTTINGINDLDQLVGFYVNGNDSTIGLLATPVTAAPEPASLVLLAGGLAGIGLARRRRKAACPLGRSSLTRLGTPIKSRALNF